MSTASGLCGLTLTIAALTTGDGFAQSRSNQARVTNPDPARRVRYRIDAEKSQLKVETETTGLSSMFGHDHKIAVRNVSGTVSFVPGAPETASVRLAVGADSFALLDEDVKAKDRRNIEATIRRVLGAVKYPFIAFESEGVDAEMVGDGVYDVEIHGDLRIHGASRSVTVPAQLTLRPESLRVMGTLGLRQSDYRVAPVAFAGGTVKVRDEVTVTFSIVAIRVDETR